MSVPPLIRLQGFAPGHLSRRDESRSDLAREDFNDSGRPGAGAITWHHV